MEQLVDLIKWCFRDGDSGICTAIVIVIIFSGIAQVIRSFRK